MQAESGLRRQLGLTSTIALIVGEVIGIGIFLTPSEMAQAMGSPFWLLVVWLVMGAMTLCGALCYGELAARFPEAGGGYVYLREAFGRPMAFLYGWVSMAVIDPGITATLAVGLAAYAAGLVPLTPIGQQAVAIGAILVLAAVNCLGVQLGTGILRALTLTKIGLLGFIAIWGVGRGLGDWSNFQPIVGPTPNPEAFAAALMSAFFSFGGWWDVSRAAGEVRDPGTTMPRALILGIAIVTAAFLLVSGVFLYLVPLDRAGDGAAFARLAGEALFGPSGGKIFSGIVILVVLGSLCSILMSQPRLYFAMARDGLFLPALARVNARLGTPLRAIALETFLASLVVIWASNSGGGSDQSISFEKIFGFFLFMAILLIALSVAALFVLRRREKSASGLPWSGYPWTAIFYVACSAALLVLMGMRSPRGAAVGLTAAAIGLIAFRFLPSTTSTGR